MRTLSGHLTQKDKRAIKAMLDAGLVAGQVGLKTYVIKGNTVTYYQYDRGLIPVPGSKYRVSKYTATFQL